MRLMLTLLPLLVCCAHNPEFTTKHGVQVWNNTAHDIDQAEVELLIDIWLDEAGRGEWVLRHTKVTFTEDLVTCNGFKDHRAVFWGCWHHKDMSTDVRWPTGRCIANTALGHELTHGIQMRLHHVSDNKHEDPIWWGPSGLVYRVLARSRKELCHESR